MSLSPQLWLASISSWTVKHVKNRTIDLMYANVRDAYTASPLPPLGKSDHNLICLTPLYTPLVKIQPITTRSIRNRKKGDKEILRDCFETTDCHVGLFWG